MRKHGYPCCYSCYQLASQSQILLSQQGEHWAEFAYSTCAKWAGSGYQEQHGPVGELWGPRKLHLSCLYDPFENVQELLEQLSITTGPSKLLPWPGGDEKSNICICLSSSTLQSSIPLMEIQLQTPCSTYLSIVCVCPMATENIHSPTSTAHQIHAFRGMGDQTQRETSNLLFQSLEEIEILKATQQGFQHIQ